MTKTQALRLYGKGDLRLETFELAAIREDEILADVQTNGICMSTYKALQKGPEHKRIPNDVAENPIIVGHEISGTILEVGDALKGKYTPGQKYSVQPSLLIPGRERDAPGYSFRFFGGHATKVIIPREVMERGCLLPYEGEGHFQASLAEPLSCIVGGFNAQYHFDVGSYDHRMGIVEGGNLALLGGTGPMGLCSLEYALHGPRRPKRVAFSGLTQSKLDRAAGLYSAQHLADLGVDVHFLNATTGDAVQALMAASGDEGYDDVFVFAPDRDLVEHGGAVLRRNGCLNFFAGPADTEFRASMNFYDVHYNDHHLAANSGGNTEDMRLAMDLMAKGRLNPAVMITHVGGLNCAADTIARLPGLRGGKKLIYTHRTLPLTAMEDFEALGETDPFFEALAEITVRHAGLWSNEAEAYLLAHAPKNEV